MSADASSTAQLLRLPTMDRSQQVLEALSNYIKAASLKAGDRFDCHDPYAAIARCDASA